VNLRRRKRASLQCTNGGRRGDERQGNRNDLIAVADASCEQREMKRRGSAIDRHGMLGLALICESRLQCSNFVSEGELSAIENAGNPQCRFLFSIGGIGLSSKGGHQRRFLSSDFFQGETSLLRLGHVTSQLSNSAALAADQIVVRKVHLEPCRNSSNRGIWRNILGYDGARSDCRRLANCIPHKIVAFDQIDAQRPTRVGTTVQSSER
jgi:hypothetical protein